MSFLTSLISFCAGVPDSDLQWDQVQARGEDQNKIRLARLNQAKTDQAIKRLRELFPAKVQELKHRILTYGPGSIEIHYTDWPIREKHEEVEELKRLCSMWKVDVSYSYPYYYMRPAKKENLQS
jgi:hypothetical protein